MQDYRDSYASYATVLHKISSFKIFPIALEFGCVIVILSMTARKIFPIQILSWILTPEFEPELLKISVIIFTSILIITFAFYIFLSTK